MKSVLGFFTELLSLSGLVAVFGYMELRAHWTYLGVSALPGIGVERYLMEVYALLGELLVPAIAASLVLLAAAAVLAWLRKLLSKTKAEGTLRGAVKWIPAILLLALFAGEVMVFRALSGPTSVALGPLRDIAAERAGRGIGSLILVLTLIGLSIFALRHARALDPGLQKWAMTAFAVMILLQTTTVYGRNVRRAIYPAVRVTTSGAQPTTHVGLLVLQTSGALELWTPAHGRGAILVLSSGGIARIDFGRSLDLFETASDLVNASGTAALEHKAGL